jgi:hypothetical protein
MYFGGNRRDVFYGQMEMHDDDEEWLAESLVDEAEEEREEAERINSDPSWTEEKIALV